MRHSLGPLLTHSFENTRCAERHVNVCSRKDYTDAVPAGVMNVERGSLSCISVNFSLTFSPLRHCPSEGLKFSSFPSFIFAHDAIVLVFHL